MIFLAGGLVVVWLVVFIFVFSIVRRQQALEQEVHALREALGEQERARTG
jgi:CcmD family protein